MSPIRDDTTTARRRQLTGGWPRAYVLAELRLRGWSMRRLSLANGYAPKTLWNVFRRRFRAGEAIIAKTLGIPASTIWPERYRDGEQDQ